MLSHCSPFTVYDYLIIIVTKNDVEAIDPDDAMKKMSLIGFPFIRAYLEYAYLNIIHN